MVQRRIVLAVLAVALVAGGCNALVFSRWWGGDFDGDYRADLVWVDRSTEEWWRAGEVDPMFDPPGDHVMNVAGNYDSEIGWEPAAVSWSDLDRWVTAGDAGTIVWPAPAAAPEGELIPVPGDYDGDGRTDPAWYRPSDATWFVYGLAPVQHGEPGSGIDEELREQPVPADYDGDGRTDLATYDPLTATWHVLGQPGVQFGQPGALPAPADFDGSPGVELASYGLSTGTWFVEGRAPSQVHCPVPCERSLLPVPADYDGDLRAEAAFYDWHTGAWEVEGVGVVAMLPVDDGQVTAIPATMPFWRERVVVGDRYINDCWKDFLAGGFDCGMF